MKTLDDLPARKKTAIVQDDAIACKAPKLTLKDGFIALNESASEVLHVGTITPDELVAWSTNCMH